MSLADFLDGTARVLGRESQRLWDELSGQKSLALTTFLRPNLGATPAPLRRALEPVVAACAMLALAVLIGIGASAGLLFLLAGALVYLIITKVFGIALTLGEPPTGG